MKPILLPLTLLAALLPACSAPRPTTPGLDAAADALRVAEFASLFHCAKGDWPVTLAELRRNASSLAPAETQPEWSRFREAWVVVPSTGEWVVTYTRGSGDEVRLEVPIPKCADDESSPRAEPTR